MRLSGNTIRHAVFAVVCIIMLYAFPTAAAAGDVQVEVSLPNAASYGVKLYTVDGQTEIPLTEAQKISVAPGTYRYVGVNGASGFLAIDEETTDIRFAEVNFDKVTPYVRSSETGVALPLPEIGSLSLFDEEGQVYSCATKDETCAGNTAVKECLFLVPQRDGDQYYTFVFTPYDEDYREIEGHFYVYCDTSFLPANTSDTGRIPYIKAKDITIKAPEGVEVLTTWQLKYYTARNWETYEPTETDSEGYQYFTIPDGMTILVRQEGKVSRYGTADDVGVWNEEKTVLTLRELQDDPNQVDYGSGTYYDYASMLTNLPYDSEINLEVGEYYDIVPLRAWQAISSGTANQHNDPEWHYQVIGSPSVATAEITADDEIGQFGRIYAKSPGQALVVFWYDAMESKNQTNNDEYGLYTWSALWPELAGIAVVNVTAADADGSETTISSNINVPEGTPVYYVSNLTQPDGAKSETVSSTSYTFAPTAVTNGSVTEIDSVRVFNPVMVEDGKPTYPVNENWKLDPRNWTTFSADSDGNYTVTLKEGRNVIEIKAGDAVKYHVVLARGLNVTLSNVYSPGSPAAVGDTIRITYENILPPVFKMAAIYNPMAVTCSYTANGVEESAKWGQYLASASIEVTLTEEDAGTYQITDTSVFSPAWGEVEGHHRYLTRNGGTSTWNGGNSDLNDFSPVPLPDIQFEVVSNDDYEETIARSAGILDGLYVYTRSVGDTGEPEPLGTEVATAETPIPQGSNPTIASSFLGSKTQEIYVGAAPRTGNDCRILVRYWIDNADASVETIEGLVEIEPTEVIEKEIGTLYREHFMTGFPILSSSLVTENTPLNLEIIVIPEGGIPTTYGRYIYKNNTSGKKVALPVLNDLTIAPGGDSGSFGRFDGVLEASDFSYVDDEENEITQDLGYGFIGTESYFTASVPYETDEIVVNAAFDTTKYKKGVVTISAGDEEYNVGDAISLSEGVNTLTVEFQANLATANKGKRAYTIDVIRAMAPEFTVFEVDDGAVVTVKSNGKTVDPYGTNAGRYIYKLTSGTYEYAVELEGYYTKTGSFTSPDDKEIVITFEGEEKIPIRSGTFQVSIHGQQEEVCALTTLSIPDQAEDLAAKRYVSYNYADGAYTVLHALLDACDAVKEDYTCRYGVLTPDTTIDTSLTSGGAGWVCEVNGKTVDPFSTLVQPGDVIRYYYNNNSPDMVHAWFDSDVLTETRGDSVTVTLMGAAVQNDGTAAFAIEGADILVDGKVVGTTDYLGKATFSTDGLLLGTHRITAVKEADGVNLLTYAKAALTLEKAVDPDADPDTTVVTFRLIGDTLHNSGDETAVHEYTTWIATTEYTFAASSVTAADVFKLALDCAGLEYDDITDNYVAWIEAPESLGGYQLKEKANGSNSGWMYSVNGFHPSYGLNDWEVTTGDEIIFHYVDDYTVEVSDHDGTSGNETVWDTWLLAEDVNPAGIDPSAPDEPVIPDRPVIPDPGPDNPDTPDDPDSLIIPDEIRDMYDKTAATLLSLTPDSGYKLSMGSEWMILGLARSTKTIPDSYENTYLAAVREYVSSINADGQLSSEWPTENARVALALTALGYDPADFESYDLMEALEDVSWVTAQGNNSTAFALLAMDACDYETTVRTDLIGDLLTNQLSSGGWNITSGDADQDTTMMVVQALAPYYETDDDVAKAVDAALDYIKEQQTSDGGFGTTAEGNAQVIVALTALGIDPASEDWCNSDGKSVIDAMADYFVGTGFMHDDALPKYNQMASEQSFYALVAYIRYLNDQPSLYDMSARDSWPEEPDKPDEPDDGDTYAILAGESRYGSIRVPESAAAGTRVEVTVKANYGYALDTLYMDGSVLDVDERGRASFIMPEKNVILLAVFKPSETQITDLKEAMNDLTVTDADEETYMLIQQILAAYDALTEEEQADFAEAYEHFREEAEYFEALLDELIEDALDDLEYYYNKFDRDDYSNENWRKIKEIYTKTKSSLRKAAYEEQVDAILEKALDDMHDVEKGGEMEVTFRLIGDFPHEDGVNGHEEYVTWIETTEYELEAGSTVYDLFVMAIDDFDLNERGSGKNYVSTIQAPDILGGYWLGEFDNGPNSGWMYTVNGVHPSYGLQDWELEDGDEVIWHYVDDYTLEERKGSSRYYYRWLEADDISPEEYVDEKIDEILTVGKHGEVDPDKLSYRDLGRNVTFKFKPDDGYVVADVIVDGRSLGSIESYTYEDLQIYSRIEVTFKSDVQSRIDELPDASEITHENYKRYISLVEAIRADYDRLSSQEKKEIDTARLIEVEERIAYFRAMDSIRLPFTDVTESAWYYDAVVYAYANGLFNGTSETTFSPNMPMSRAMLVTVLWRLEGQPWAAAASYTDVSAGAWYADAVAWAAGTGIVNGIGDGRFDPDGSVTREQIATILYRYSKIKGWDISAAASLTGFADGAAVSDWAVRAMEWACGETLIVGKDGGRLDPGGQATRAEVATILMRLLESAAN